VRRRGSPQQGAAGDRERGSGSVLVVAMLGAIVAVAASALAVIGAVAAHTRAAAAADLAALAAADAVSGRVPGIPCELANVVARANGAALTSCTQSRADVTVATVVPYLGASAGARARAGPPP